MLGTRPCGFGGSYELSVNNFFLKTGRLFVTSHRKYRVSHHSTSDDSFAYRPRTEVEDHKKVDNPITRFRLFMESQGWWNADAEIELKARLKEDVIKAFKRAETLKRAELSELFTDVYGGEQPWHLVSLNFIQVVMLGRNCLLMDLECAEGAKGGTRPFVEEVWK
jgi:hypothetical protein